LYGNRLVEPDDNRWGGLAENLSTRNFLWEKELSRGEGEKKKGGDTQKFMTSGFRKADASFWGAIKKMSYPNPVGKKKNKEIKVLRKTSNRPGRNLRFLHREGKGGVKK